jgi:tetratricopeptide (TPR) repeat protein
MKNFADIPTVIRSWSLAALLVLAGWEAASAGAVQDADKAFAAGDYPTAQRAYQTALSSQGPSAGLYYNLAITQLRQNQPGEASLSLRRAIMLDPRMIDARIALSDLERSQGVPPPPLHWTARWKEILAEKAPLPALMITGCVVAWIAAFLLLRAVFRSERKFRAVLGSLVLLAVGAGLFSVACLADPRISERHAAVVLPSGGTTLLSAPADQSAVVTKIPAGGCVYVHRRSGEWTYCETPSGEKGWTATKSLEPVVPTA